ncbi:MAG: L,D-transpeptidase [Anaerolineae bacterium]|nr:L,D-transpeptidase [Anaerolineae bacterium]
MLFRRACPFLLFLLMLAAFPAAAQDTVADAGEQYGLSEAQILAYEVPDFDQLTVDPKLLHDRNYMKVTEALNVYDAPNGNVTRTLDAGFNFLTTFNAQDGWTQINNSEWVPTANLTNTNYVVSEFTGVFLPEAPLQYSIAWVLGNVYASEYPGGPALETNELFYRYKMVNLFDVYELDGWRWYQVGPDQWIEQRNIAKYIPIEQPEDVDTERWVSIDLYEQVLTVHDGEQPIFVTLISSGLPRWPTYEGLFHINYRKTREQMSWGTPGDDFYYLEEVPWTMYFDEGRALHGAYWHDGLGYRRSHGCVNMSITDAHWLYQWVAEEFDTFESPDMESGPAVYVYSSGEYVE